MRAMTWIALLLAGSGLHSARAASVTEDAFLARTTADLVTLCNADKADPMYTPAQNFCHGFAVGTYGALAEMQQAMRTKKKLFCPPRNPPNRTEAIAAFVQWAGGHPDLMTRPPVDGVVHFLVQQYPCE